MYISTIKSTDMKKTIQYILLITALALPARMVAQMGEAYQMMVNGVKVIVQPAGNDIVVIQTIVKGGVENYTATQAGIESLAISGLTECGTAKDDKNSFKDKLDKVSAQIGGNAGMDYSSFNMNEQELPGFGHMDVFIGKASADDVYPKIDKALTDMRGMTP